MNSLPERIMEYAEAIPEATPFHAQEPRYLGDRAAVAQTLSRLAGSEWLLRTRRAVQKRPIQTRSGLRVPRRKKALAALSEIWDEAIVPNGGGR